MHGLLAALARQPRPRAAVVIEELVQALALRSGLPVRPCHLDFTEPAPDVALRRMAADGFTSVRVVPLLFTPGYHVTHDVPEAIEASGVAGRMDVSVAPALVSDELRARELLLRALERAADRRAPRGVDAIVLASAGSSSRGARSAAEGVARDLGAAHGVPAVAAFASAAAPSPADAVRDLRNGGAQRPVVASLFVAPGRLPDGVTRVGRRRAGGRTTGRRRRFRRPAADAG